MSRDSFTVVHRCAVPQNVSCVVAMATCLQDNHEWLFEAVDSILQQSFQDFVFAIVLDGPVLAETEAKLIDLAQHCDKMTILQNVSNMGLAASMNHVIEWSSSFSPKYFARMDADDISHPQRLERQVNYLEHHRNIAVLGTALNEINESGEKVGARVMPASHLQIIKMLPRRCSLNHPTVMMRYEVFSSGIRYQSSLRNTQDYFLWIVMAQQGYVFRNLKDKLLDFRRVNDFYKRRGLDKSINVFKARLYAMRMLGRWKFVNVVYALAVLCLRLMPSGVVKLAYKLDRILLDKFLKH